MKQYLLGVISAAVIGGIVTKLLGDKGAQGAIGKLIAGLFLTFTVLSPLRDFRMEGLTDLVDPYTEKAQSAAQEGEKQTAAAISKRIKQACEAYILDKAEQLDTELAVTVTLDDGALPTPVGITLTGNISPNSKKTLQDIITQDLGIPREAQIWK